MVAQGQQQPALAVEPLSAGKLPSIISCNRYSDRSTHCQPHRHTYVTEIASADCSTSANLRHDRVLASYGIGT
jgi:hypothetical protein